MKWRSEGRVGGQSFQYDGVCLIEFGEDAITAFRVYTDPRQLSMRPGSGERAQIANSLRPRGRLTRRELGGGYS